MKIIQIAAEPGGGRPPLQEWPGETLPQGCAWCPEELAAVFYSTAPAGFVHLTLNEAGDTAVSLTVDREALAAWQAAHPAETEPAMPEVGEVALDLLADHEERICVLELGGGEWI